jgi:four helix bundle protein
MTLTKQVYALTSDFPKTEQYGLTSQIRRSAVSIPSNIAEGSARGSTKEFVRFVNIALGSLAELETQLLIAVELKYLESEPLQFIFKETDILGKMLRKLQHRLTDRLLADANP